jgi:hypothetical protein
MTAAAGKKEAVRDEGPRWRHDDPGGGNVEEQADELHIEVEPGLGPRLEGGPEGSEGSGSNPAPPPAAAAVSGWTGAEAQVFLSMFWNIGCFAYGIEWAARDAEFVAWRDDAGQLLDLVLPKSVAGPAGLAVALTKVAGGIGMMAVARVPLIARGPVFLARRRQVAAQPDASSPSSPTRPRAEPDGSPPTQPPGGADESAGRIFDPADITPTDRSEEGLSALVGTGIG